MAFSVLIFRKNLLNLGQWIYKTTQNVYESLFPPQGKEKNSWMKDSWTKEIKGQCEIEIRRNKVAFARYKVTFEIKKNIYFYSEAEMDNHIDIWRNLWKIYYNVNFLRIIKQKHVGGKKQNIWLQKKHFRFLIMQPVNFKRFKCTSVLQRQRKKQEPKAHVLNKSDWSRLCVFKT